MASRRGTLLAVLLCLGLLGCADRAPPNIVLIVIDTLRADRLSIAGYPLATTPEIDRRARQGTWFRAAAAQASWTVPSMISMFTGRYITRPTFEVPGPTPTIAETLRQHGYRTLGFSANRILNAETGTQRGFDHFDLGSSDEVKWFAREQPEDGRWYDAMDRDRQRLIDTSSELVLPGDPIDARNGRQLNRIVLDHLDHTALDGERQPTFLYVHYMEPHSPYDEHPDLAADVPDAQPPEWEEIYEKRMLPEFRKAAIAAGETVDEAVMNEARRFLRRLLLHYDREVRAADRAVGELLDGLEERGFLDGAVVFVTADHGELLCQRRLPFWQPKPEPGSARIYDYLQVAHAKQLATKLLDVPLIAFGGPFDGGGVREDLVELVDLHPTILDVAGIPKQARGLEGRSLLEPPDPLPLQYAYDTRSAWIRDEDGYVLQRAPTVSTVPRRQRLRRAWLSQVERDPLGILRIDDQPARVKRLHVILRQWEENRGLWNPRSGSGNESPPVPPKQIEMMKKLGYVDVVE